MTDVVQPTGFGGQVAQFAPLLDWANGQVVAYTTTTQSNAINAQAVILSSSTDCWINIGSNPTATVGAGSLRLPAGVIWGQTIARGQKIAAIQEVAGGNLSIIPILAG